MKNAVRIICGIALLSSLAFASASGEVADSLQNRLSVDLGVSLEGAFGLWNVKLEEDHIRTPEFGFGVSSLWGIGHLAFRISALGKYQAVYVSEGTQATINEGFWRLGAGVAVRLQENSLEGFWTEIGSSWMFPLRKSKTLCEGSDGTQDIRWFLKTDLEVPLEFSLGYRIPVGFVSLDFSLFGMYDLTKPLTFRVNENERQSRAWNVGFRTTLWGLRF